jgi:hypothetical protein
LVKVGPSPQERAHGLPFCCFPARDGHRRRKPSHFSFPAGAAERGPRAPNTRSEPLPRQQAHRSNGSDDRGPPGLPPFPWHARRMAHVPARILLAHRLRPRRAAGQQPCFRAAGAGRASAPAARTPPGVTGGQRTRARGRRPALHGFPTSTQGRHQPRERGSLQEKAAGALVVDADAFFQRHQRP